MTRISSKTTFFFKRIFPLIWFGFLAFIAALILAGGMQGQQQAGAPFALGVIVGMAVFGYVLMVWLLFRLADEVWDARTELIVRNRGRELRIPLADIVNVNYNGWINPPQVVLLLRTDTEFGREIRYTPRVRMFAMTMPSDLRELIDRIDAARNERG